MTPIESYSIRSPVDSQTHSHVLTTCAPPLHRAFHNTNLFPQPSRTPSSESNSPSRRPRRPPSPRRATGALLNPRPRLLVVCCYSPEANFGFRCAETHPTEGYTARPLSAQRRLPGRRPGVRLGLPRGLQHPGHPPPGGAAVHAQRDAAEPVRRGREGEYERVREGRHVVISRRASHRALTRVSAAYEGHRQALAPLSH